MSAVAGCSAIQRPSREYRPGRCWAGGVAMKVKDVMTRGVECVRPDTPIQEAAVKMKALNVGPMPVCEGDRVTGILTDRDIVLRVVAEGRDPRTTPAQDAMTNDVFTVEEED